MSTTEQLFAAVYAEPASDAPRQVLADHLLERGDPRGEFIALQLQQRGGRVEKQLLKRHRAQWLGKLASDLHPQGEIWTRGFPSSGLARLQRSNAGDPRWNTLETLDISSGTEQAALQEPCFRALKDLRGVRVDGLEALLSSKEPPRLEALHSASLRKNLAGFSEGAELALVTRLKAFPTLKQLNLETRVMRRESSHLDWLWTSELAKQLTSLRLAIVDYQSECLAGCLEAVERLPGLTRFTLSPNYFSLHFSRGSDGRFSILELQNHGATNAASTLGPIADRLGELPPDALLEFRYTSKGKSFTAEEMQPMKHAVAKQQRLEKEDWRCSRGH